MSIFFGFLFLFSLLALVVGLIFPKAVLFFSKTKTRKRAAMLYLLLFCVSLVGLVATTQDPQPQVVAEATQTQPPTVPVPEKKAEVKAAQAEAIVPAKQKQQELTDKKLAESKRLEAEQAAEHKEEVEKKRKAEAEKKRLEQEAAQKKAEKERKAEARTFNFDLDNFIRRYNAAATNLGQAPVSLSKTLDMNDGSGQVHTLDTHSGVSFMVTTNNKGFVKESTLIGAGDGTPDSGLRIIMGMGSSFDIFEPGITKDGRADILKGLGLLSGTIPDKSTYTRNGVTYSLINTKGMGIWLTARPAS